MLRLLMVSVLKEDVDHLVTLNHIRFITYSHSYNLTKEKENCRV